MTAMIRCGVLVGVLAFLSGCSGGDLAPTPFSMPSLSGPATTYHFSDVLLYPVQPYTITSRYVLHDNGAFELVYPSSPAGGGTFFGIYERNGERISFRFAQYGRDDGATGTLHGDTLEVRYTVNMQVSDFEDAVYRRSR